MLNVKIVFIIKPDISYFKFEIRNICKSKNLCIYKYYENCGF